MRDAGDREIGSVQARIADLRWEIVGFAVLVALASWYLLSYLDDGGRPWPVWLLLAAVAGAYAVARVATGVWRPVVPVVVLAIAAVVAATSGAAELLSRRPLSGPFEYANAKSAFFAMAAIAGLMLARLATRRWVSAVGLAAAAGAALVPFASDSTAASAAVLGAAAVAALVWGPRSARTAVLGSATVFLVVLVVTVAIAVTYTGAPQGEEVRLTQRRLTLWHDAVGQMADHPLTGVGPGRFGEHSPTAQAHPQDSRWAHHGFLQTGAEAGIPAMLLLVGLFLWGFARLGMDGTPDAGTALAAFALAALGWMACVDYVLHFPAITVTGAALVGAGVRTRRGRTS